LFARPESGSEQAVETLGPQAKSLITTPHALQNPHLNNHILTRLLLQFKENRHGGAPAGYSYTFAAIDEL
jgi:hypothetical protein